jgi:hypothetical protein
MQLRPLIVDRLPRSLWKPGNLYMPFNHRLFSHLPESFRVTSHSLHFCVADSVRTFEWDGREIVRGAQPFTTPES